MAFACQALVARLRDGTGINANHGIISGVLVTVGDLARVVGNITRFVCVKSVCLTVYSIILAMNLLRIFDSPNCSIF
jgi:hypothetical protein